MGSQRFQRGSSFKLIPTRVALRSVFLLSAFLLKPTWALQVTPNSVCASVCMDDPTQDVSDPNVSNTVGSDIVCIDGDYGSNPVGQKYEKCIDCLQSSNSVASGENDQAWFLCEIPESPTDCCGTAPVLILDRQPALCSQYLLVRYRQCFSSNIHTMFWGHSVCSSRGTSPRWNVRPSDNGRILILFGIQ
jgi:hypothetical protein